MSHASRIPKTAARKRFACGCTSEKLPTRHGVFVSELGRTCCLGCRSHGRSHGGARFTSTAAPCGRLYDTHSELTAWLIQGQSIECSSLPGHPRLDSNPRAHLVRRVGVPGCRTCWRRSSSRPVALCRGVRSRAAADLGPSTTLTMHSAGSEARGEGPALEGTHVHTDKD